MDKCFNKCILSFHITSRPPMLVFSNKETAARWCPDPILGEMNSIIMKTFSFIFVEKMAVDH